MTDPTAHDSVTASMDAINRAWLDRRPEDLAPFFHPDLTMVFPGFEGRAQGREAVIAGFVDFCNHATVHEYSEKDFRVDLVGDTAIASYLYEMVYERSGERYRAAGRDLWVLTRQAGGWLAVWRTMLDLCERPA
jgi:uncharacterized protein (TIGR02246 family)